MHKTGSEVTGKHSHWYRLEWHREDGRSRLISVSSFHHSAFLWEVCNVPSTAALVEHPSLNL